MALEQLRLELEGLRLAVMERQDQQPVVMLQPARGAVAAVDTTVLGAREAAEKFKSGINSNNGQFCSD